MSTTAEKPTLTFLDGWFAQKDGFQTDHNPFSANCQTQSYAEWRSGFLARETAFWDCAVLIHDERREF